MFSQKKFCIGELGFKQKEMLIGTIQKNGGTVSGFVLEDTFCYIIGGTDTSEETLLKEAREASFNVDTALEYGIPFLSERYVWLSVAKQELLNMDPFRISSAQLVLEKAPNLTNLAPMAPAPSSLTDETERKHLSADERQRLRLEKKKLVSEKRLQSIEAQKEHSKLISAASAQETPRFKKLAGRKIYVGNIRFDDIEERFKVVSERDLFIERRTNAFVNLFRLYGDIESHAFNYKPGKNA